MSIKDAPRGEITETIGGVAYRLKLTNGEVEAFERSIGNVNSFLLLDVDKLTRQRSVAIVYHAMRGVGSEAGIDDVRKILDAMHPQALLLLAVRLLNEYWDVGKSPQKPKASP